jgi:hypothetical protein
MHNDPVWLRLQMASHLLTSGLNRAQLPMAWSFSVFYDKRSRAALDLIGTPVDPNSDAARLAWEGGAATVFREFWNDLGPKDRRALRMLSRIPSGTYQFERVAVTSKDEATPLP